jgi:hypothetical protein
MPKRTLEIKDFSGGINVYSDSRDINDNEFAQAWNANLSQTGIIKTGGSLVSSLSGLPHSNTNFQTGYGLFATGTDHSLSIIDGEFEVGFEFGTVAAESTTTNIQLAAVPSKQSLTNHSADDYYNNCTILISSGPGAGQTRTITDYTGSSKLATIDSAFDTNPTASSEYKIFRIKGDGTSFGTFDSTNKIYDIFDIGGASSYSNDDIESASINNLTGRFLRTKNTAGSDNTMVDLGYVTFNPVGGTFTGTTLKAGVEYTLSFKCKAANRYYNYVSDTNHGERPPFVQLYSTTNDLYLFQSDSGPKFLYGEESNYEFTTDIIQQYVANGDFETSSSANAGYAHSGTSAHCPPTNWNAYDYNSADITYTQETTSEYGGESASVQLAPDSNFSWNLGPQGFIPEAFMYQELTLDDNQWHELFFAYSSANSGMAFGIMNAKQGLVPSGIYIDGADTAASGSVAIAVQNSDLGGAAAPNCTTSNLVHRMIFDADGNFLGVPTAVADTNNFTLGGGLNHTTVDNEQIYYGDWIAPMQGNGLPDTGGVGTWKLIGEMDADGKAKPHKFFVPDNGGTPYKVIIFFAPAAASHNIRLDGISVRKSFPDLTSMSLDYGTNSPYSDEFGGWEKYSMKFTIPTHAPTSSTELTTANDWVLNLHAGTWGRQDSTTGASTSQTIYFDSVRLESNEPDNLTFLNDNTATESKVMVHSENSNTWMQFDELVWSDNNMMPVYTYINGLLKISDANFNNSNKSRVLYHKDYSKLSSNYKYSNFQVVEHPLSHAPSLKSVFGQDNMYISSTFNALSYSNAYTYTDDDTATTPQKITGNVDANWILNKLNTLGRTTFYRNVGNSTSHALYTPGGTQYTTQEGDTYGTYTEPFYIAWAGDDNTTNDMGSISGVGNVAKVDFSFIYDSIFAYRHEDAPGDRWYNKPHPSFTVKIGKMGADVFNGTGSPIADGDRYKLAYGDVTTTEILNGRATSTFESDGVSFDTVNDNAEFSQSDFWNNSEGVALGSRAIQMTKEFNGSIGFDATTLPVAATDDMIMEFDINHASSNGGSLINCLNFPIYYDDDDASYDVGNDWNFPRYERIIFNNITVNFYNTNWSADDDGLTSSESSFTKANLVFGAPTGSTAVGWEERSFIMAVSSVNIFDEESNLNINANILGENSDGTSSITAGTCPTVNLYIGDEVAADKYRKKLKYYMKDTQSSIWYLQFYVDLIENKIYSTTSNYSSFGSRDLTNKCYTYVIPKEKMLNYNEVDSYESQTLISQELGEGTIENLVCDYKSAVVLNNRLYVGNIKQNGEIYPDRMIKSPIGKYNILPKSNFIDVAINDGDEIVALSYYKDKLLQFKKHKVFVINTSGDYEFLEDTFDDVGINYPCEVTDTPYGPAWINKNGCFLYDGSKLTNLMDNKLDNKADTSVGIDSNYWQVGNYSPSSSNQLIQSAIGYNNNSKDLVIRLLTANTTSLNNYNISSKPDGYIYNFPSNSWYMTMKSFIGKMHSETKGGLASNFAVNKDGELIQYEKADVSNTTLDINHIMKWSEELGNDVDLNDQLAHTNSDNSRSFTLVTKDYDFGDYAAKKNIYKVYVTFKSLDKDGAYQASGVKAYFSAGDGAKSWTEFDNTSVDYDQTNGLNDTSASSTEWITAELKINNNAGLTNRRSIQLRFYGGTPAVGFQINDISIVYRIKSSR